MASKKSGKPSTMLQRAINLAVKAHDGQIDPDGLPYILHPMRVMDAVATGPDSQLDEAVMCVGILHDTIEDTDTTLEDLKKAGMSPDVIKGVDLMTHRDDVSFADYVVKLKKHRLARAVKIADLLDNSNQRHLTFRPGKAEKDEPRLVRYAASYKFLTDQVSEKEYREMMKGQK